MQPPSAMNIEVANPANNKTKTLKMQSALSTPSALLLGTNNSFLLHMRRRFATKGEAKKPAGGNRGLTHTPSSFFNLFLPFLPPHPTPAIPTWKEAKINGSEHDMHGATEGAAMIGTWQET